MSDPPDGDMGVEPASLLFKTDADQLLLKTVVDCTELLSTIYTDPEHPWIGNGGECPTPLRTMEKG